MNKIQHARKIFADSLGIANLTVRQQDTILAMIMDSIAARATHSVWNSLAPDEREQLKAGKFSGAKAVTDYLVARVAGLPEIIEGITRKTIADFKEMR